MARNHKAKFGGESHHQCFAGGLTLSAVQLHWCMEGLSTGFPNVKVMRRSSLNLLKGLHVLGVNGGTALGTQFCQCGVPPALPSALAMPDCCTDSGVLLCLR